MIVGKGDSGHGGARVEATGDTLNRRVPPDQPRWPRRAALPLAVAGYVLLFVAMHQVSTVYWFLPAGLRFSALWLSRSRHWGWFALAEIAAVLIVGALGRHHASWAGFALAAFAPWCAYALAVLAFRPGGVYAAPESPGRMGSLLAAMALAGAVNALAQTGRALIDGPAQAAEVANFAFAYLIGDFVGMLMLVPVALQILQPGGSEDRRRMGGELLLVFAPFFAAFGVLWWLSARPALYAALLAVVPMLLMAFRHGWRGAAWAIGITSVALYLASELLALPTPGEFLQLLLCIFGAVALLLGAAIGALRRMNAALADRNLHERAVSARLAVQADELRDLGRRLARAREDEQARLAHELHDELGQMVTALGTRLGLLARKTEDPELLAGLHAQRELVQRIQESIREVLHALRPPVLDRFGLEAALREGPVERLLADAGIEWQPHFSGPIARIGPDVGSAIYRISQEAATNCVRHARANSLRLQLDAAESWGGGLEVHLRIEDDGTGLPPGAETRGNGLRGIRDRVLALAGDYRCDSDATGTRHLIWFIDRVPVRSS